MTMAELAELAEELRGAGIDPSALMEIALILAEHEKRIAALEHKDDGK